MPYKNTEECNAYRRKWRMENRHRLNIIQKEWREKNKTIVSEYSKTPAAILSRKTYRKNYPWFRFYKNAKERCTQKSNGSYKYYGEKGIEFNLTLGQIKSIWFRDKAFNLKTPSIDRINPNGNYDPDNCRFIELSDNRKGKRRKTR